MKTRFSNPESKVSQLVFMGYFSSDMFRLYRLSFRNKVFCYLIPGHIKLSNFQDYEISASLALSILGSVKNI